MTSSSRPPSRPPGRPAPKHEARDRVWLGQRELSWRRTLAPGRRRDETAKYGLLIALPVIALILAGATPQPARLVLILAAAALGVLALARCASAGRAALRAGRDRKAARAGRRPTDADIIARYEQQLADMRARHRDQPPGPADGAG
ncbi:MAG TPA: hypothetical protein VH478_25940 [Trebonia sp.]|nr:hypothetical protein [Trebonia sp.]